MSFYGAAAASVVPPTNVQVIAPATLVAGYTFDAMYEGVTFSVVVPEGGVIKGQRFIVPFIPTPTAVAVGASSSSSSSSSSSPERVAPDAGRVPDWEDRRNPISVDEFMNSDPDKPDAGNDMWECPLTRWDAEGITNIGNAQARAKENSYGCPLEIRATSHDDELGAAYFEHNRERIRSDLIKYGAIWFRGFALMRTVAGNRMMHEALGLEPCLDPLHSSGLRKFASERDALYEEVSSGIFFAFWTPGGLPPR